jgi:hypothetical protein
MIDPLHAALIAQAVDSAYQVAIGGHKTEARELIGLRYRDFCTILGITPLDLGKLGEHDERTPDDGDLQDFIEHFSLRVRSAFEGLGIRSWEDLENTTPATLMGYRAFGKTSLREVEYALKKRGLSLA